jgi:RNA polymerase sigma factor (sigma-70 family)
MASALLGDADDAADAVQDAFVKAYRGLARLKDGSDFGAWFRQILRNHCVDRLRSAPRRRQVRLAQDAVDASAWAEAPGAAAIEAAELARAVRYALSLLSPEHREILTLKELEEMSYAEIARAMGIPGGTVASRLHHARAALRRIVESAGVRIEWGVP